MIQNSILINSACLVALDMDNTILEGRFIDTAAEALGHTASLMRIRKDIADPMLRTQQIAELLKDVELETIRRIADSIPIVRDAKTVISELKNSGCIIGIISDSYDCVTDHLKRILDLDFALSNHLVIEGTKATGTVIVPDFFEAGETPFCEHVICKSHAIAYLSKRYGIDPKRIVAVGDSENDICMVKFAGVGVAFCTEDIQLLQAADHVIKTRSFQDLLEIVSKSINS